MSFLDDDGFLSLGWSPQFQFYFDELNEPNLVPARILSEDRSHFSVQLPGGAPGRAVMSGKFRNESSVKPAVGDWIACEIPSGDHNAIIGRALLPRKTCVQRAKSDGPQVIASNVDSIFITTSANSEFNLNRLDRYVAITFDSGAEPIIILSKVDLMKKDELQQLLAHFPSIAVYGVSMKDPVTYAPLYKYLQKGSTVAMIGSSGVGKSTLINHVMGFERQKTNDIREDDSKGRHTTTRREFFLTPFGGWIVDTPGMRELGMLDQQLGLDAQYADILELGKKCRFNDCEHRTEPGCAILRALQKGELDQTKWDNYLKLKKELEFHEAKGNKALEAEKKKTWKQIHKDLKSHYNSRKNE